MYNKPYAYIANRLGRFALTCFVNQNTARSDDMKYKRFLMVGILGAAVILLGLLANKRFLKVLGG